MYGSFLAEAASHCLRHSGHPNPVDLCIAGDVSLRASFMWCGVTEQEESTWADLQEATEYGAYGVAILVVLRLTDATRIERSAKGTGIDYWVGDGKDERGIFQRTARLEVSGILKGDKTKVAARLAEKLSQTRQSDKTGMPAYVVIVEFGSPEVIVNKRAAEMKS